MEYSHFLHYIFFEFMLSSSMNDSVTKICDSSSHNDLAFFTINFPSKAVLYLLIHIIILSLSGMTVTAFILSFSVNIAIIVCFSHL